MADMPPQIEVIRPRPSSRSGAYVVARGPGSSESLAPPPSVDGAMTSTDIGEEAGPGARRCAELRRAEADAA
jgi:hypothetical protein